MAKFAGDKKVGQSILSGIENRFKAWAVPKIPKGIETYHLTMTTVIWSLGNVGLALLAAKNIQWLWLVNLMIVLQYITDLFDGAVGRMRNTGLIKWGFYMDHFLDYIFLCSLVFVGYKIAPPGYGYWYFGLVIVLGAFMVNSFLSFATTNAFEIYYYGIGPTETRVFFILINIWLIIFKTKWFNYILPGTFFVCLLGLVFNTWQIQRKLWKIDMENKASAEE